MPTIALANFIKSVNPKAPLGWDCNCKKNQPCMSLAQVFLREMNSESEIKNAAHRFEHRVVRQQHPNLKRSDTYDRIVFSCAMNESMNCTFCGSIVWSAHIAIFVDLANTSGHQRRHSTYNAHTSINTIIIIAGEHRSNSKHLNTKTEDKRHFLRLSVHRRH